MTNMVSQYQPPFPTKKLWADTNHWTLAQMSTSYRDNECTRHIASRWYTNMPNMVIQWQTKTKLWAGHESAQTDGQIDSRSFTGGIKISSVLNTKLSSYSHDFKKIHEESTSYLKKNPPLMCGGDHVIFSLLCPFIISVTCIYQIEMLGEGV